VVAPDEGAAASLRVRGHHVAWSTSVADGLARSRRERPDVVVVFQAPGEPLGGMGGGPLLAGVPVIAVARGGERPAMLRALRDGAHDAMIEPVDPDELEARMLSAVRVKRLRDALVEANERLARQALIDDLTGLPNRRNGLQTLQAAVSLGVRHGRALGIVRIDIDRFKAINDTHGHQAGDGVLAEIGRRLAGVLRGGDEVARWGGDEFVALLPDTDREGVPWAAERLRAAVAAEPVALDGASVAVTVSVGWAHWAGDTPDDLLLRADRALYAAKAAGRDNVQGS